MERPVDKYRLGLHHLAQPTMDPEATLEFYVDGMGAKITHCIASRGWRPKHYDYIHMFLELDNGDEIGRYPDNIAMFYYFGVEDPSDWPRYGTHHSFAAKNIAELDAWEEWLKAKGYKFLYRSPYEIMTSFYVEDPNGRILEIAAQHRPVNEIDADDAQLTAQALVLASKEKAKKIDRMWAHKARLVEERHGELGPLAIIFPKVGEFDPLVEAAGKTATGQQDRGNFLAVEGQDELRLTKPADLPEAVWWGAGTGGVKGKIAKFDEQELVITG